MDFGVYNVSMDDKTTTQNPSFRFLIVIDFLRFQKLASWLYAFATTKQKPSSFPATSKTEEHGGEERLMTTEEMKWVMGNLGIDCGEESVPLFGSTEEVAEMFDERAASTVEVKKAFDVFDVNGDGFIDSEELQRVMCVLGFKEGERIQNCERMIRKFDHNGDGRIDFEEFLKLMESVV
ncbi:probable calcium-binding protein CML46 [Benincasa hispida]|uniref:probable calcium-binding protein CML46 n=1 Tax=Benincasa hispida TaxID=102211 RepID=UPI00190131CC|nr:probable calcium-binding protein CML46 [Benincasa hispida]